MEKMCSSMKIPSLAVAWQPDTVVLKTFSDYLRINKLCCGRTFWAEFFKCPVTFQKGRKNIKKYTLNTFIAKALSPLWCGFVHLSVFKDKTGNANGWKLYHFVVVFFFLLILLTHRQGEEMKMLSASSSAGGSSCGCRCSGSFPSGLLSSRRSTW